MASSDLLKLLQWAETELRDAGLYIDQEEWAEASRSISRARMIASGLKTHTDRRARDVGQKLWTRLQVARELYGGNLADNPSRFSSRQLGLGLVAAGLLLVGAAWKL